MEKSFKIRAFLLGFPKDGDLKNHCINRISNCGINGVENETVETLLEMCEHLKGFAEKKKIIREEENTNLLVLGFSEMENLIKSEFEKHITFDKEIELEFLKKGATVYSVFKNGRRPLFSTRVVKNKNGEVTISFSFNSFRDMNELKNLFPDLKIEVGDEFNNLPIIKKISLFEIGCIFSKKFKDTTFLSFLISNLNKKYKKNEQGT